MTVHTCCETCWFARLNQGRAIAPIRFGRHQTECCWCGGRARVVTFIAAPLGTDCKHAKAS